MDAAAFLTWIASGKGSTGLPVLIVVAHPDDEVIGLGGQLARLRNVTILHVTDGAPRDGQDARAHGFTDVDAYARARRGELLAALALAGIGAERALELGIPDQQAALHLPELACRIARMIEARRPAILVTHPYEGGHPDHDATAFGVQAAVRCLGAALPPLLLEMASYHAGSAGMETGRFLPAEGQDAVEITLSPAACALKQRMIDCFTSQKQVLAAFPPGAEVLRAAPAYDFTHPPHAGRLFYEDFPWGMTGEGFRQLAAEAWGKLCGGGTA